MQFKFEINADDTNRYEFFVGEKKYKVNQDHSMVSLDEVPVGTLLKLSFVQKKAVLIHFLFGFLRFWGKLVAEAFVGNEEPTVWLDKLCMYDFRYECRYEGPGNVTFTINYCPYTLGEDGKQTKPLLPTVSVFGGVWETDTECSVTWADFDGRYIECCGLYCFMILVAILLLIIGILSTQMVVRVLLVIIALLTIAGMVYEIVRKSKEHKRLKEQIVKSWTVQ